MAKDPAFLFYSSDWLTGCADLTMEERGQYMTLMCLQHQKGHLSKKTIGLCLGLSWDNLSEDLRLKFSMDENGYYYNERLESEINRRAKHVDRQRENGKKGGRPPKDEKPKINPNETQIETELKAKKKPLETENENAIETVNNTEVIRGGVGENPKPALEAEFETFRKAYPGTKRGLDTELKTLKKHDDWREVVPKLLPALENEQKWRGHAAKHGGFVPAWANLQTWLNQRRWESELNFNDHGAKTNQPNSRENIAASLAADAARLDAEFEQQNTAGHSG